jgi:hypothetical protein
MSQTAEWQCLSVQDFFTQQNWNGKKSPQILSSSVITEVNTPIPSDFPVKKEVFPPSVMSSAPTKPQGEETHLSVEDSKQNLGKKSIPWECLTVEDFFGQNNWLGNLKQINFQPVLDSSYLAREKAFQPSLKDLPEITLDTPQSPSGVLPSPKSLVFSLTLSVEDFCNAIEWEGKPAIALLPQIKSKKTPTESEEEFTIDDLSNLF